MSEEFLRKRAAELGLFVGSRYTGDSLPVGGPWVGARVVRVRDGDPPELIEERLRRLYHETDIDLWYQTLPVPVAVISEEGGYYRAPGSLDCVAAIFFEDGTVWDAKHGWRTARMKLDQVARAKKVAGMTIAEIEAEIASFEEPPP